MNISVIKKRTFVLRFFLLVTIFLFGTNPTTSHSQSSPASEFGTTVIRGDTQHRFGYTGSENLEIYDSSAVFTFLKNHLTGSTESQGFFENMSANVGAGVLNKVFGTDIENPQDTINTIKNTNLLGNIVNSRGYSDHTTSPSISKAEILTVWNISKGLKQNTNLPDSLSAVSLDGLVERIYAIALPDGRGKVYYLKGEDEGDATVQLMTVRGDKIYVHKNPLVKASGDESSYDVKTEQGFFNSLDAIDKKPRNTFFSEFKKYDKTLQERNNDLQQERENLQNEISGIEQQIGALTNKQQRTAAEEAQLKELLAEREVLQGRIENSLKEQTENKARLQGNIINTTECSIGEKFNLLGCITTGAAIIGNIVLKLSAYFLGITGTMFDYSIELAVNSAEFIEKIGVVNPIWTFLRDILNMTFIFILVWIAIQIIIDRQKYTVRKDVVRVVVVAILINFSLFAAKIFVDGSNLATLQLYQATKAGVTKGVEDNISVRIMQSLGFTQFYNVSNIFSGSFTETINGCGNSHGTLITVSVFGTLLMLITGLAFLTVGVLFFTRMANIIYLFVTSPLWVWGHIIDGGVFKKVREHWWNLMTRVVKFPIIFMLYMFIAMFAFTKMSALTYGGMSFLTLLCVSEDTSIIGQLPLILNFCLVIWVILAALKYGIQNSKGGFDKAVTKKFGGWAEAASTGLAKKIGTKAQSAAKAAPKAVLYGTKEVLKQPVQRTARFVGKKLASSANNPAWVRNMGGKMAEKNKDITFFGKTGEQRKEAWKKWWAGEGEQDAKIAAGVAEGIHSAPKFQEKGFEEEDMNAYKYRLQKYAEAKAGIYLNSNILKFVDEDKTKNPDGKNHRERIVDAAIEEVEDPKDKTKKIYKLREERMRKQINDTFEAHTRKGRLAKFATHDKGTLMSKYKAEAREKGFKSVGSEKRKNAKNIDKLRAELEKVETDLKNHPENLTDLEKRITAEDKTLTGIINIYAAKKLDGEIKQLFNPEKGTGIIKSLEDDLSKERPYLTDDQIAKRDLEITKNKETLAKKEKQLKDMKEAAIESKEKREEKIKELKAQIKEIEKK